MLIVKIVKDSKMVRLCLIIFYFSEILGARMQAALVELDSLETAILRKIVRSKTL
jgi:hypothetical protein